MTSTKLDNDSSDDSSSSDDDDDDDDDDSDSVTAKTSHSVNEEADKVGVYNVTLLYAMSIFENHEILRNRVCERNIF